MPITKIIKRDDVLGIGYGSGWAGIKVDTTDKTLQWNADGTMRTAVDLSNTQTITGQKTFSAACTHSGAVRLTGGTVSANVTTLVGVGQAAGTETITALIAGGGNTTTPCTTSVADKNFLAFFTSSTATSGDSRGMYLRHYFKGVGGSGEALRAYATVSDVSVATGGTVNGAHISLNITGANGKISGAAHALRATLDFDTTPTTIGGTVDAVQIDTNIATGPTIPTGTSFINFNNIGSQKLAYLIRITNPDTSAMFVSSGTSSGSPGYDGGAAKAIKISVGGVDYWLAAYAANG